MLPSRHKSLCIPHNGTLCRLEENYETFYIIAIVAGDVSNQHDLVFTRSDLDFAQRLFSILDTESRGVVSRYQVREFTTQRCPVFWRRDDDLRKLSLPASSHHESKMDNNESPTFDEIWNSVMSCSQVSFECRPEDCVLGLEGTMVLFRFIALAQYSEAKRRFSARHLQQTMRHRNSPRGSEVVMVNVPPPEPPAALSPDELASHEQKNQSPLPLPELDLDHSLLAVYDSIRRTPNSEYVHGKVKIQLFGQPPQSGSNLEVAVTFTRPRRGSYGVGEMDQTVVRRSLVDFKWLDDTVKSHKTLGGTLCGRILPPFPRSGSRKILSEDSLINSSIKNTGGAIAAAAKGMGKITSAAKSIFGSYLQSKSGSSGITSFVRQPQACAKPKVSSKHSKSSKRLPEGYYNPNSPDGKARQLERYLNYLLAHPALSTSFPLNAILTASQSGLESAKRSLEECNKAARELREQTPHLDDGGKMFIPLWAAGENGFPDFTWVRTAAQAAMALRLHGMLETTGMPSASARLQHAALPAFGRAKGNSWDDDASTDQMSKESVVNHGKPSSVAAEGHGFEDGVIRVRSELQSGEHFGGTDDSYDLLPLPVPAPERQILTVGNTDAVTVQQDARFHYGGIADIDFVPFESHESHDESVLLGNMSVDDNIDKLREVIGSVDNTLSRCFGSIGSIGAARRERLHIQLDLIRGLDSWEGMRGTFISERSLLRGDAGISQSKEIFEESDLMMVDDLMWQTSLAHAAVGAAEDVRSAIRASRTASNAKAAANAAAMTAQNACATDNFASLEEARAAQTRNSIAQSHAIHAAVVDHEANAVKRRATLALAHDVKCWNLHRKSELLISCLSYSRSQHEATRRAVDAWSSLRDGFIGSPLIPSTKERRAPTSTQARTVIVESPDTDPDEMTATIFGSGDTNGRPVIVATEHSLFCAPSTPNPVDTAVEVDTSDDFVHGAGSTGDEVIGIENSTWDAEAEVAERSAEQIAANEPGTVEVREHITFGESLMGGGPMPSQTDPDACDDKSDDFSNSMLSLPFATASPIPEKVEDDDPESPLATRSNLEESKCEENLSASMQSLVDGLMSWGGGLDVEEDYMTLPAGMAASIALEASR